MKRAVSSWVWPLCAVLMLSSAGAGARHDLSFQPPSLLLENFLDLKSYDFSPDEQRRWNQTPNGFRISGGSLDKNRLYVLSELSLFKQLNDRVSAAVWSHRLEFEQNDPETQTHAQIGVHPWGGLMLAFFGTPSHEKRLADLGVAVAAGRPAGNRLRLAYTGVDYFYNKKNDYDNSRYLTRAQRWSAEGYYRSDSGSDIRVDYDRVVPYMFEFDDGGRLRYADRQWHINGNYIVANSVYVGASYAGSQSHKQLQSPLPGAHHQHYRSVDIYTRLDWRHLKLTAGARYDRYRLRLLNPDTGERQHYLLRTHQGYISLEKPFQGTDAGGDLGVSIYTGANKHRHVFTVDTINNRQVHDRQGKLKFSLAFHDGADNNSTGNNSHKLSMSMSLNLDNIIADPLDGGGISYQAVFP